MEFPPKHRTQDRQFVGRDVIHHYDPGTSLDVIYRAIPDIVQDAQTQERLEGVIDQGAQSILDIMQHGGLVTTKGIVLADTIDQLPLSPELLGRIEEYGVYRRTRAGLRRDFGFEQGLTNNYGEQLFLIARDTDKRLGYVIPRQRSIFFDIKGPEARSEMKYLQEQVFLNMFAMLYREAGFAPIISSSSLTNAVLFDISNTWGQGELPSSENKASTKITHIADYR